MAPDDLSPPDDEDIEATFRRLREEGHSRLEAMRMILDVLDVSLAEAKQILARRDTWKEARAATGRTDRAETTHPNSGNDSVPPAPG
jgi:hypothetical protein